MQKNRSFLLILVCLALGVLVFLDNRPGDSPSAPPSGTLSAAADDEASDAAKGEEAPAAVAMQLSNPLSTFDKAALKDWVGRPLFAPSRQRPAETAAAAPRTAVHVDTKLPPPSYDLLGIVRDGEHAIALLRKKGDGRSFRVEVGDMIGGWRVARMEPASVVLERADGTSQTVPLARE